MRLGRVFKGRQEQVHDWTHERLQKNGLCFLEMGPSLKSQLTDPHRDQPVLHLGVPPPEAAITLIFIHGRGATAESILTLYKELSIPNAAALAPQAANSTWYPQSFLAPLDSNEPYLSSALWKLETIMLSLLNEGVAPARIAVIGFSQGACLALEHAVRHPRAYGALIGFTGALIGPPGAPREQLGSLEGTPVFLGTSEPDPHVPLGSVVESKEVLERLGAKVELRRYQGLGHTINQDELNRARELLMGISAR